MDPVKQVSKWPIMICVIAVAVSLAAAAYFYSETVRLKQTAEPSSEDRGMEIVEKMSQLIILPTDEQPTVAEITEPEKLAEHPFLNKAKKGDYVIVYTNAQKAYIFDPVANKIIDVGSVTIGQEASVDSPTESVSK